MGGWKVGWRGSDTCTAAHGSHICQQQYAHHIHIQKHASSRLHPQKGRVCTLQAAIAVLLLQTSVVAQFAVGAPFAGAIDAASKKLLFRITGNIIAHLLRLPPSTCHLLSLQLHSQRFSFLAGQHLPERTCKQLMKGNVRTSPRHIRVLPIHYWTRRYIAKADNRLMQAFVELLVVYS